MPGSAACGWKTGAHAACPTSTFASSVDARAAPSGPAEESARRAVPGYSSPPPLHPVMPAQNMPVRRGTRGLCRRGEGRALVGVLTALRSCLSLRSALAVVAIASCPSPARCLSSGMLSAKPLCESSKAPRLSACSCVATEPQ